MARLRFAGFVGFLIAALAVPAAADRPATPLDDLIAPRHQEPADSHAAKHSADELQARRAAIGERLAAAQKTLEAADVDSPAPEGLASEVERLKRQKVLVGGQQAAAVKNAELEIQKRQLAEQLSVFDVQGLGDPPPYSFFLLDQLRDEQRTLEQRAENAGAAIRSAADSLAGAKNAAEEAHRKRRQAADSRDGKPASSQARLAELDAQLADDQVELRKIELAGEKLNSELLDLQVALARKKIEIVAPQVTLTEEEQREKLAELDKDEADIEFACTQAEQRLEYLCDQVDALESAAQSASSPDPRQAAELEARRAARAAQQQYVNMLTKQLSRLADCREAWTRRFAVERGTATREQLSEWSGDASAALEELAREHRLQIRELSDARKRLADLEHGPQSSAPPSGDVERIAADQRRVYQELIDRAGENLTTIELARRVHERLLGDIREGRMTLAQRLDAAWEIARRIWTYELVVSDDQPVTISMVVWGVVLLVGGLIFSRWASNAFAMRFLPRLGVHERAAAALKSISFYTLVSLTGLVALRWVNVPLTLFTFLGGALAIGVGFGSQNLVNNFISGLILLAERPIRVGDVIELDGLVGTVDTIGARSTRVCTGANYEIIVPNSSILEKNVINWTLSDKRVRSTIKVGVAYGSPTREVAHLLKKAAEEHGLVLDKPEPTVVFADFGDNALHFELNYWIQIRAMSERGRIESDLRFIIDQYFRDANLVIAYPQRDLHLSSEHPLKVTVLPPASEAAPDIARAA